MKYRAKRLFHPKLLVEQPGGVRDQRNRRLGFQVLPQVFLRRMKYDHFLHAVSNQFIASLDESAQVQVAHRAPGKTPKLQVSHSHRIGYPGVVGLYGFDYSRVDDVAGAECAHVDYTAAMPPSTRRFSPRI